MTHKTLFKFLAVLAVALALAAGLFAGCTTTVRPGEVGVEMRWGKIAPGVRQPDWYFTALSSVERLSTRTQTYTMEGPGRTEGAASGAVSVLARDQLPVVLDVTVMFHLNGERVIDVFKMFGADYDDDIVHPLVRTAVRDAASEFTAVDLVDRRAELQARMGTLVRDQLAATLAGRRVATDAVIIDQILIRNIDLPTSLDESIAAVQRQRMATDAARQATLTAQQEAARALAAAQGDAAALLARTRADAEMLTIRTQAQAAANRTLAESLTPTLLASQRIDAVRAVLASNQTRTVFVPPDLRGFMVNTPQ